MYNLIILDECDSTQEELKKRFKDGDLLAILSKKQLKGKGSYSREWISDEGGLYLSFVYPIIRYEFPISTLFSVLVIITLKKYLNYPFSEYLGIIYPNDLIIKYENVYYKVGGVLVETFKNNYVVGVGINVNNNVSNYHFEHKAISLKEFSLLLKNDYKNFDVVDVARAILNQVSCFHSGEIYPENEIRLFDFTNYLNNIKVIFFMDGQEIIDQFEKIKIDYANKNVILYKGRMRKDFEFEKIRRILY
ncbi:MAG: biotin--[acetyl-CoA-carboxylase] ligase [Candidatus Calescibacterium sp.]|nr:biotin--[acetyl-CoA-carboxylase] ligase [Candidatus Calescibacterium sp.]MDW8132826.1 biotin--[acetyl-CoA-carboxylase] ligase [Candidatus Calescibacterium sp.]